MNVLIIKPDEYPRPIEIKNQLEDLQAVVGGCIECVYPFEDKVGLVVNDEGKLMGLPLNRALRDKKDRNGTLRRLGMAETVKERLDDLRQKAGAKEYKGHGYMSLYRFMEDTRHMVIMDILTDKSIGEKGDRMRLYLTPEGYRNALKNEKEGNFKIISHAYVSNGHLYYDKKNYER